MSLSLLECLRRAREIYLDNQHQLAGSLDYGALVVEAANGDALLASKAVELLDDCSPGHNFGFFADGGTWTADGPVYLYDKKPVQIAAVMGKAIARAALAEEQ